MMFIKKELHQIQDNVFDLIGHQWMLITAGNRDSYNTMTASWGGLGVLWHKNVATIYIRPQRYTLEFVKKNDFFTLCFFNKEDKKILNYCGSHSGREVDKAKNTGLIPEITENGSIMFSQAKMIFECKKIYFEQIKEDNILDKTLASEIYNTKDFHWIFIGEIMNCLMKK